MEFLLWGINEKWNMFITSVVKLHTKSCRHQAFTAPANSSHPTAKQRCHVKRRPFLMTSRYDARGSSSARDAKGYRTHLDKTRGARDKKVGMWQTGMRTGWNDVVVELPSPAQGHHLCFLWCRLIHNPLGTDLSSSQIFLFIVLKFLFHCSFIYVSLGSLFSHFYPPSPYTITSGSESELWRSSRVILMRTSKLWALSPSEQLQPVPSQARGQRA